MGALQELVGASFRGIPFLTPSGTGESGRHSIKHEYPDSNMRYVEDNGLVVPDFKLKCVIHGSDALQRLRSFEAALNTPGPGTLIHPLHGRKFVQVMGPTSTKYDDNNVGVYEIAVTFSVTGPPFFPGALTGIAAAITGMSSSALGIMFSAFQSGFSIPLSVASQIAISTSASNIISQVANVFGAAQSVQSLANSFTSFPDELVRDATGLASVLQRIVQAPIDAVEEVIPSELWSGFIEVYEAAKQQNDVATAIEADTLDKATRKGSILTIANTMAAAAICGLCVAAAAKTYQTSDEVSSDSSRIIDIFQEFLDGYGDAIGPETREALSELVNETISVLQNDAVSLPNVTQSKVWEMPASVLTYLLYEGDANLQTIIELNESQSPILLDGVVNVLHS